MALKLGALKTCPFPKPRGRTCSPDSVRLSIQTPPHSVDRVCNGSFCVLFRPPKHPSFNFASDAFCSRGFRIGRRNCVGSGESESVEVNNNSKWKTLPNNIFLEEKIQLNSSPLDESYDLEDGDEEEEEGEGEEDEEDEDYESYDDDDEDVDFELDDEEVGDVELSLEPDLNEISESELIQVGRIVGAHSLKGNLRVFSMTDFPEERFQTPGIRWIKRPGIKNRRFEPVYLLRGKFMAGKAPTWLIRLKGVNTRNQAEELKGSIIFVSSKDKPELDGDEFYSNDLIGLNVYLKETDEYLGIVENVFSSGANDLLRVEVFPKETQSLEDSSSESATNKLLWVPFVKEIVPIVDFETKSIKIVPPPGLLELNTISDENKRKRREKEEKREEIKKNRILRQKFSKLKKVFGRYNQIHVLDGLKEGSEDERDQLYSQLQQINLKELQSAVNQINSKSSYITNQNELDMEADNNTYLIKPPGSLFKSDWSKVHQWDFSHVPESHFDQSLDSAPNSDITFDQTEYLFKKGLQLISEGKCAVVVLAGGQATRMSLPNSTTPSSSHEEKTEGGTGNIDPNIQKGFVKGMIDFGLKSKKSLFQLQAERIIRLQSLSSHMFPHSHPQIPFVVLTSDFTYPTTKMFFNQNHFFGLEESQVYFIKQGNMPCIKSIDSSDDNDDGSSNPHFHLLLESPHKVALAPNGNGGLYEALYNEGILDVFNEKGIEYVQVHAVDNAAVKVADPVFYGYCDSKNAEIGIKIVEKKTENESMGVVCLMEKVNSTVADSQEQMIAKSKQNSPSLDKKDQHYAVIEYSEMGTDLVRYEKESGKLMFRAGHICVNLFSVSFLNRIAKHAKTSLPFHAARKKIPHCIKEDGEWKYITPEKPNGIKFEKFIFDSFAFCDPDKVAIMEVNRDEEFAPIKNSAGKNLPDSPETALRILENFHKRIRANSSNLESDMGGLQSTLHEDSDWEISPLTSYAGEKMEVRQ